MTKLILKFSFLLLRSVCLWMEDYSAFDEHDYLEKHRKVCYGILNIIVVSSHIGRNYIMSLWLDYKVIKHSIKISVFG